MDLVYRRRKSCASTDLLSTVFQLSFCTLGASYAIEDLAKPQQVRSLPLPRLLMSPRSLLATSTLP